MDSTCIAIIVSLVILVGLSAWCSSTETAYSSVNKVRLKNKAEDGNPRAQNALDLLEKYDKVLSCILIGNNIVNLTAATLGTVLFTKLLGPVYGPAASTAVSYTHLKRSDHDPEARRQSHHQQVHGNRSENRRRTADHRQAERRRGNCGRLILTADRKENIYYGKDA